MANVLKIVSGLQIAPVSQIASFGPIFQVAALGSTPLFQGAVEVVLQRAGPGGGAIFRRLFLP